MEVLSLKKKKKKEEERRKKKEGISKVEHEKKINLNAIKESDTLHSDRLETM